MWPCTSSVLAVQDRCNPLHPLYGVLPVPYVPVQVTRGAVIAHRHSYVKLCASSLRNLAVSHVFYYLVSISVE